MRNSKVYSFLTFLVGALSSINITVFGLISITELISVISFPILLLFYKNKFEAFSVNEKKVLGMIAIWTIAIVISDVLNQTPLKLFLKGIGHPIIILTLFFLFSRLLIQNCNLFFKYFILGQIFSSIFNYLTNKIAQEYFRFGILGIIVAISFSLIYYFWKRGSYIYSYIVLFMLMTLGFIEGGRSSGLTLFLTIVLLMYSQKLNQNNATIGYRNIMKIASIFLVLGFAIQETYVFAVKSKLFSQEYQTKFEAQLNTGLPLLLSGRTEIFSSLEAIQDSPFIGHGSWKKDLKYTNIYFQKQSMDVSTFDDTTKTYGFDKIPAHSFFFGAWVEHGILAALFFLFFGKILLNVLIFVVNSFKDASTPYLILLCLSYFWHLFFSPLGSDKRIFIALIFALNSYYINNILKYSKTKMHNRSSLTILNT